LSFLRETALLPYFTYTKSFEINQFFGTRYFSVQKLMVHIPMGYFIIYNVI